MFSQGGEKAHDDFKRKRREYMRDYRARNTGRSANECSKPPPGILRINTILQVRPHNIIEPEVCDATPAPPAAPPVAQEARWYDEILINESTEITSSVRHGSIQEYFTDPTKNKKRSVRNAR